MNNFNSRSQKRIILNDKIIYDIGYKSTFCQVCINGKTVHATLKDISISYFKVSIKTSEKIKEGDDAILNLEDLDGRIVILSSEIKRVHIQDGVSSSGEIVLKFKRCEGHEDLLFKIFEFLKRHKIKN